MGLYNLDKIFRPDSVAVIGASEKEGSIGHIHVRNLVEGGYQGKIFPVHPHYTRIHGLEVYPSLTKIEHNIDLAIIAIPIASVPQVIKECVEVGVGGTIVVSAGGRETGVQGLEIEEKLSGRKQEQAEYENIKTQMSALKKDYEDTDEKYIEIKNEISQLNKRAVKLYLQIEPSPFVRFFKKIQQIWRTSKTIFFIQLILITILIMIAVTAYYQNNNLQTLLLESGFTLILIIIFIRKQLIRIFLKGLHHTLFLPCLW